MENVLNICKSSLVLIILKSNSSKALSVNWGSFGKWEMANLDGTHHLAPAVREVITLSTG